MSYISEMRKHIGHAPMLSAGATVIVLKDNQILLNRVIPPEETIVFA